MTLVRFLLVDGYNVIHQTPEYSRLAADDLDAARAALVSDVAAFADRTFRATIVFDGHNNPMSTGVAHHVSGVTVLFSRFGLDADTVIEALARESRERGDATVVVTSDAQTQWAVLGGSVTRMSSSEFAGELRLANGAWSEHSPTGSTRSRIQDRVDASTRERMARWARGLP